MPTISTRIGEVDRNDLDVVLHEEEDDTNFYVTRVLLLNGEMVRRDVWVTVKRFPATEADHAK